MAYIKTGLSGGGNGVTLTVSCEEDFLGETLTLSDGTTTLTSVVSSTLSVVFDITESGTWTLTNSLTSESIPFYIETEYSATLSAIPDGKTVTPTDDIQIWLKCASINNKPYTTLAEVLNDEAVLCTLMATDNAVDYLVRSTTWAVGAVLTPTMTSNTTPEGTCIRRSVGDSTYEAWKAFDGDESTRYLSVENVAGEYVGYVFAAPTKVFSCEALLTTNSSNYCNQTVKVQASNDNFTTAVDLTDSFTFSTRNTDPVVRKKFTFNSNIGEYSAYRILRTDSYLRFVVHEIYFRSASITDSEVAMRYIGASDYASETLLLDSTWLAAINDSEYKDYVANVSVPKMTSNTTPEGVASSSSDYDSSHTAYIAFDKSNTPGWCAASGSTTGWLQYKFPISRKIYGGVITNYGTSTISSKDFIIRSSTDGVTFEDRFTSSFTAPSEVQVFNFASPVDADYFRCAITSRLGSVSIGLIALQFYGREYGSVQTWLRAAGITNKLYTSLSEVLNDTATLSTLMASEDAVDYLVTAKSWINSKELVPTMTSNTAPSGTCFGYNTYSGTYPWYAFNKNYSNNWASATNAYGYVGYIFDTPQIVEMITMTSYYLYACVIEASNDTTVGTDGTWVQIGNELNITNTDSDIESKILLPNNTAYKAYRLRVTNGKGGTSSSGAIRLLQFHTASITEFESAMTAIGNSNYASDTLLADSDWRNGICNSAYFESVLNVKVPIMTSNSTPSGICSASSTYTDTAPWKAFDRNNSTEWDPASNASPSWLMYEFPTNTKIYLAWMRIREKKSGFIAYIQGSNDNSTWETLYTHPADTSTGGAYYEEWAILSPVSDYKYYRWYTSQVAFISGNTSTNPRQMQFYGREDV